MSDPEFACALSHSKIYHKIIEREISCAIILENDITISDQLVPFFYNPHLDVLCLAYNAENGFAISQNLMITSDTQTMSCYILEASAISELLDCIRFSVENLSLGGAGFDYAIDQVWKQLQRQIFFALTKDHFARQRPSFSDIEQSHQNYGL